MVHPLEHDTDLPVCPGKTMFEVLVETWHDQALMRLHMEGLHERELARSARPPVLQVTVVSDEAPSGQYQFDPETGTVAVAVTGPLPAIPVTTGPLPAVRASRPPEPGDESPG